jgi:hypothetical protein
MRIKFLASIALAAAVASHAEAMVTVTLSGTQTGSSFANADTSFTASFVFDETQTTPTSTYSDAQSVEAQYAALQSITFTSGGISQTLVASPTTQANYGIFDSMASGNGDAIQVNIQDSNYNYLSLSFRGDYQTLTTAALTSPIAFNPSTTSNFYYEDSDGDFYQGNISPYSIQVPAAAAVPEPATWVMMIGGFGMIGLGLRRRRAIWSL